MVNKKAIAAREKAAQEAFNHYMSNYYRFWGAIKSQTKSDYIYLCREERYGRNGNLRSLRKADMTPDVVRTYFWGFIKKYWRELLWMKN